MRVQFVIPVLVSILILGVLGLSQDAFADFEVIDLGFWAFDINDSGQIVGFDPSTLNGVIWEDGVLTPISDSFRPRHINEVGQVAGFQFCSQPTGQCPAIWDSQNGVQLLEILPNQFNAAVIDINDSGVVIGSVRIFDGTTDEEFAVLWDPITGIQEIGNFDGPFSRAEDINNAGQIIIRSRDSSGVFHESFWENGVVTVIGESNHLAPLNEAGQVAAFIGPRGAGQGVFWDNGVFTDLGDLGIDVTIPSAINDLGQVAGSSTVFDNGFFAIQHAFIWDSQNGIQDLGTLTGGEFSSSTAFDMNNAGQVVGFSCSVVGFICPENLAFVWDSQNGMQGLDPVTTGEPTWARHINEAGQILGSETQFNNGPGILWNPLPSFDSLREQILSFDLPDGLENALISKVDAAEQQFENGNIKTATNILDAFINLAEAQTGKKIDVADAADLQETASKVKEAIKG